MSTKTVAAAMLDFSSAYIRKGWASDVLAAAMSD